MAPSAMLHLPPRYLQTVCELLRAHLPDAEVWAYGSRARGDHYAASDLDLVVRMPKKDANTRVSALAEAKDAFADSDLPIIVQIVDWDAVPARFHDEILAAYAVVQPATQNPELQHGEPMSPPFPKKGPGG